MSCNHEKSDTNRSPQNLLDDPEEKRVVHNAVNSFHRYRDQAHYHITHKRRQAFYALPQNHWQMLAGPPFNVLTSFDAVDEAIDINAKIADALVASGVAMYGLEPASGLDSPARPAWTGPVNPLDQEKAHSTIKQLYRDWSAEGAAERAACHDLVISALEEEYEHIPKSRRGGTKILVPGAGLGRLVFELVRAGYSVEGNEISYHQLIASNFMLNCTQHAGQFELHPWIHSFSNHVSRSSQLQKVLIPDVHPATELQNVAEDFEQHPFERMSFSSADFCVAYKEPDAKASFDAVATVFFIDTAPNLIRYVDAVRNCLKENGIWINLGPLKWHFEGIDPSEKTRSADQGPSPAVDEGIADPGSVELTEDEVIALVERMGFRIERHALKVSETGYIGNANSMWQGIYRPSFWVARKAE